MLEDLGNYWVTFFTNYNAKKRIVTFDFFLIGETKMPSGGYRAGAGRPTGSFNKTTSEQSQRLSELAKDYTYAALLTLVDVAKNGRSDAARVSAANALLDRGYGKPAVKEEIEAINLSPVVIQVKAPDDNATE